MTAGAIGISAPCAGVLGGWLPDGQPERLPVDDGSAQTRANRALSARRRGVAESALHIRFIATFKSAFKAPAQ
jgi:hypothetical protein